MIKDFEQPFPAASCYRAKRGEERRRRSTDWPLSKRSNIGSREMIPACSSLWPGRQAGWPRSGQAFICCCLFLLNIALLSLNQRGRKISAALPLTISAACLNVQMSSEEGDHNGCYPLCARAVYSIATSTKSVPTKFLKPAVSLSYKVNYVLYIVVKLTMRVLPAANSCTFEAKIK